MARRTRAEADDLEVEVEVARADPDEPEQALEVLGLVQPLVQPDDDAAGQLGGPLLERDDLRLMISSAGSRRRSSVP